MATMAQFAQRGRTTLKSVLSSHVDTRRRLQIKGDSGVTVRQRNGRLVIGSVAQVSRGSTPWRYSVDQAARTTVTVATGDVIEHTVIPYTCPSAVVSVTGGTPTEPHHIVLQHVRGGPPSILPVASAEKPVSEPGVFRCTLYDVGIVRGRVRVFAQRRFGDIDVPGYV